MDSIRVSEAPDPGSIPGEATAITQNQLSINILQLVLFFSVRYHVRFEI